MNYLFWKNLSSKAMMKTFDQSTFSNFPKDTKINKRGVSFSDAGDVLYFSINYRAPKKKERKQR